MDSSVVNVLDNKYFDRLWIVQEVLLPSEVKILYGRYCIPWRAITRAIVNNIDEATTLFYARDGAIRYGQVHRLDLEHVLRRFSANSCKDSRDKIYGLLRLFEKTDFIEAEYNKPVAEVLVETVSMLALHVCKYYPNLWLEQRPGLATFFSEPTQDWTENQHFESPGRHTLRRLQSDLKSSLVQFLDAGYEAFCKGVRSPALRLSFYEDADEDEAGFWYGINGQKDYFSIAIRGLVYRTCTQCSETFTMQNPYATVEVERYVADVAQELHRLRRNRLQML